MRRQNRSCTREKLFLRFFYSLKPIHVLPTCSQLGLCRLKPKSVSANTQLISSEWSCVVLRSTGSFRGRGAWWKASCCCQQTCQVSALQAASPAISRSALGGKSCSWMGFAVSTRSRCGRKRPFHPVSSPLPSHPAHVHPSASPSSVILIRFPLSHSGLILPPQLASKMLHLTLQTALSSLHLPLASRAPAPLHCSYTSSRAVATCWSEGWCAFTTLKQASSQVIKTI